MPRIRCINVFYKGDYPVTLLPPPRRLGPSLGLGTTWVRQLRSGSCHHPTAATKCNEQPSQSHRNPVGGKACSSTKGGSARPGQLGLLFFPITGGVFYKYIVLLDIHNDFYVDILWIMVILTYYNSHVYCGREG